MNDFTKDELQSIWRWADAYSDKEWYRNLAQKIRPMIDNYCEHEEKETVQIPAAKSIFQNRCKKCRRLV